LKIVRITPQTMDRLDHIAPDVFDGPIASHFLQQYLAAENHALFAAMDADILIGQVRGMIQYHPDKKPELFIDNLGVTPSRQRRGIATQLLEAITAWGRSCNCSCIWVLTEPDNHAAHGCYESIGFSRDTATLFVKAARPDGDP
jgi:ribosomal protein S18 acetylase RimI-like enzyme